ncbi:hypothetical protein [Spirosoma sp.]|uniref:hypothetical protein n=1 Tax=Spirosoma sp. TaxID=1899569 RepID=UPI0026186819|nr:hypothetical protein [Spirosoma sp.]MCX6216379.1 hypothetical protein [Spirosoma sp.]
MTPIDRTPDIPALPNHGGQANVPGLRRLWLIEARHVLAVVDPRTVPGILDVGWHLPSQGLNLTEDAIIYDWRFRSRQGSYEEKTTITVQGIVYGQSIKLVVPKDAPETTLACYRMGRRKWLAIYHDSNGLVRLVGTPNQPLRFDQQLTIGANERVLTFTGESKLPSLYITEADVLYLSALLGFESDFSLL